MIRWLKDIQVSPATVREAETVARIVRASFKEYRKGRRRPLSARLSAKRVMRQLRRGEKEYALARIDGRPAGAIGVRRTGRVLLFGPVGVVPEHRAQGVGAALLRWAEERAAAGNCVELKGEVLWGLDSLVRYYRRRGFRIERTPRGKTLARKQVVFVK